MTEHANMPTGATDIIGQVLALSPGADGFPRQQRVDAISICPTCGNIVLLIAETEAWVENDDGDFVHDSYGPAEGVCCSNLFVDYWEGCFVYRLEGKGTP